MKKQLIISLILGGTLFFACSENEHPLFPEEVSSIYFELQKELINENRSIPDSLFFSFVGQEKDTIKVPLRVKIMGNTVSHKRTFKAEVIDSLSTAKKGIDYDISESEFIVPADSFISHLPVTIYKTSELQDTTLRVSFKLLPSDDFELGLSNKLNATLLFTNNLTPPSYWVPWGNRFFGPYSRGKHELLMTYGVQFPEEASAFFNQAGKATYGYLTTIGAELNLYLTKNYPVYDGDGQIIEPWK